MHIGGGKRKEERGKDKFLPSPCPSPIGRGSILFKVNWETQPLRQRFSTLLFLSPLSLRERVGVRG
jgi:hypothetical protein